MTASTPGNPEQEIASYYVHGSLLQTILAALKQAGVDPERPAADDLAPVDEFHIGGRMATVEFAGEMGIVPGMRLLDVGSGIGGPSRYFAAHRGCFVTGIDLSPEFCDTAKELSSRTGLGDRTEYRVASAGSLPFDDAIFDGAYMLHVGMNLPAKADVFHEVARVLKSRSVFGIFDVMREAEGDLKFPVPWAASPEMSFVETAGKYTDLLREAGFEIEKQRSRRDFAIAFFTNMRKAASGNPPPLGLPIVMGSTAPVKVGNLLDMIERGLLSPTEIVCRKP
jgi:ubiquinone/menaquinone biosynthesis C-methylase UbiE